MFIEEKMKIMLRKNSSFMHAFFYINLSFLFILVLPLTFFSPYTVSVLNLNRTLVCIGASIKMRCATYAHHSSGGYNTNSDNKEILCTKHISQMKNKRVKALSQNS